MKIIKSNIRPELNDKAKQAGFNHHVGYWDESQYYQFSMDEIDAIAVATDNLHAMCLDLLEEDVFKDPEQFLPLFDINIAHYDKLIQSWNNHRDIDLYGRMDLGYNGKDIKLIEYNADTPTALWEAAVFQWDWMTDVFGDKVDQFNMIHDSLVKRMIDLKSLFESDTLFFLSMHDAQDDIYSITYLEYIAQKEANWKTFNVDIGTVSATGMGQFTYSNGKVMEPVRHAFKLYPWEWMMQEEGFAYLVSSRSNEHSVWINPLWKVLLSSKAILPLLWRKFPDNQYLIRSCFTDKAASSEPMSDFVVKPLYSREGQNIVIQTKNSMCMSTAFDDSSRVSKKSIVQEYFDLECDNQTTIIGSWLVGGESVGLGLRASDNLITDHTARFVPHIIKE